MQVVLRSIFTLTLVVVTASCQNKDDLAESSFGPLGQESSKASPASVISMGRDDDDGRAKKWHIGGKD